MSVETYRHNRVLVVKMKRPGKRNALNSQMTAQPDVGKMSAEKWTLASK